MAKKKNVWKKLEARLREVFPYPWPETNWRGEPINKEELDDYYETENDPLIPFLIGKGKSTNSGGIEFVEFEGSFYEGVDYDSIPQGTEDACNAVIRVDGVYYKVGLIFTSYRGYMLDDEANEVTPKVVEVVIYE